MVYFSKLSGDTQTKLKVAGSKLDGISFGSWWS